MRGASILIIGSGKDPCVSLTRDFLHQRGIAVFSFEADDLLGSVGLYWPLPDPAGSGFLQIGDNRVSLADIGAVLVRHKPPPLPDPDQATEEDGYIAGELQATLLAFLQSLDCLVICRPDPRISRRLAVAAVEWRPAIHEAGFRLARVLATADPAAAHDFCGAGDQPVLLRSPSGLDPWKLLEGENGAAHRAALMARHPVYLQELPGGRGLRVFVVGERVLGCDGDLSRVAGTNVPPRFRAVALSPDEQQQCRRLARLLDLEFAQMDLVETESGELYCLDVSPWPELESCEPELQRMMATALADLLEGGWKRGSDDPGVWRSGRPGDGVRVLSAPVPAP
jgi:hypothetical protein